jgi:CheY-like chemotaxis protein
MSISVLVVEVDIELGARILQLLTLGGYEARAAVTVEEAIARLNENPAPCLVLWDPVMLESSGSLIAQAMRRGVPMATIPVSVSATDRVADGTPLIAKRLTSREAVLAVVREHCPAAEEPTLA